MPNLFPLPLPRLSRLPWPLPAVVAWSAGWLAWAASAAAGPATAFAAGVAVALATAGFCRGRWRQGIAAAGFPLSALALGLAATLPSWAWLLLMLPLFIAYPLRAWRDAPFFPTPARALVGLDRVVATPPANILDAGCGLGHGLAALRRLWPQAQLHGVEWSPALAAAAAWRCRFASVRRGDMWAASWSPHDLVYVFQRPESMARVWAKALAELRPGAWLVSLEFEVPGPVALACLRGPQRRPVWVYRMPLPAQPGSTGASAGR